MREVGQITWADTDTHTQIDLHTYIMNIMSVGSNMQYKIIGLILIVRQRKFT